MFFLQKKLNFQSYWGTKLLEYQMFFEFNSPSHIIGWIATTIWIIVNSILIFCCANFYIFDNSKNIQIAMVIFHLFNNFFFLCILFENQTILWYVRHLG